MQLRSIEVARRAVRLKVPFVTALRRVEQIECVVVTLTTDDGKTGFGEAAPARAVTGETADDVEMAIVQHLRPALLEKPLDAPEALFELVDTAVADHASAKAAVDMALYDLLAQGVAMPLYRYLGGYKSSLRTDFTVSIAPASEMAASAERLVKQGYHILKLKLGQASLDEDFERVREVRERVGPSVQLRLDANQAWSAEDAISVIGRMEDAGLDVDLVEQPVRALDLEGLKRVTDSVKTKVMADESVFGPEQAFEVLKRRAADLINIKLLKCGGIRRALIISDLAALSGIECMIGSMIETRAAVTAAAHFAASRRNVTRCDLDAPLLLEADGVEGGIVYDGELIRFPETPGLGIRSIAANA